MIITGERTGFQETIVERYGSATEQLDRSQTDLLEAFPVGREGYTSEAVLEVNGVKHESFRHHVGVLDHKDLSRGGGELTPDVTSEKVLGKSLGMKGKHMLIAAADTEAKMRATDPTPPEIIEPNNEGGKSGVKATKEQLRNMTPSDREELIKQHVEAHNINPMTNVMATDINTFVGDMNAAARALTNEWGSLAGAAASGVSEEYGGEPKLQAPRTGQGASIALDEYFRWRAERGDKRVQEALDGGRPLTILLQGLGKAGAHHLLTLPSYLRTRGVMERDGALVAKGGIDSYLDLSPEEIMALARQTQLGKDSASRLSGVEWLEPGQLSDFWASGAHVIGPCYDRNQFGLQDAINMSEETIVGEAVANGPFTKDSQPVMGERGVDIIPEPVSNVGGTAASRGVWEKFMYPGSWSPEYFEAKWEGRLRNISRLALARTAKERVDARQFVSISHATDLIVLETAFSRLDSKS
jgi:glutamate dehydrogenase/leucine dehydrogenase